jgi:hypothetical protein
VAVDKLDLSKSPDINAGDVISIDVTVSNKGDYTESFGLILCCNNDVIDSENVSDLVPDASEHLSFTWDTQDIPAGPYTVKALAAVVPGEFNVSNNRLETTVEVIDKYILSISSTRGGSVTKPGEGIFTYECNTTVEIEAAVNNDYYFIGWTGSAVRAGKVTDPSKPSTTVLMDGNYSLMATFTFLAW